MRALITGCVQNCGPHFPAVLANVELLRGLCSESRVLLLENNSTDQTVAEIRAYAGQHDGIHALGFPDLNAQIPIKTVRLAHLRNTSMEWLALHGGWSSIDLLVVLDFDEVNGAPWDLDTIKGGLHWLNQQPDAAGLFANQLGPYYDLWALRHREHCADDVWAAMFTLHGKHPEFSDQRLLESVYLPREFCLAPHDLPLEVESAFGGLAFYRSSWLARAEPRYVGETPLAWQGPNGLRWLRWQCCEHVAFHRQIRAAGGRLWIYPQLINWNTQAARAGGMRPNPAGWRHLVVA